MGTTRRCIRFCFLLRHVIRVSYNYDIADLKTIDARDGTTWIIFPITLGTILGFVVIAVVFFFGYFSFFFFFSDDLKTL